MISCPCGKTTEATRYGAGWTNALGRSWCAACFDNEYTIKAATFRGSPLSCEWSEARPVIWEAMDGARTVANVVVRTLALRDTGPKFDITAARKAAYDAIRAKLPDFPTGSANQILQEVQKKYLEERKDIYHGKRSLPNFREVPYPFRPDRARLGMSGEIPTVTLGMPGDRRMTFQLHRGKKSPRQMAIFLEALKHPELFCQVSLLEVEGNASDHRAGTKKGASLRIKIVAYVPKVGRAPRSGALILTTTNAALLTAMDAKDNRLFIYNGDHIRGWVEANRRKNQRLSFDRKLGASMPENSELYERRMKTAVKQVAAHVVGYADRRRFAEICWLPTVHRYVKSFRWADLETRIGILCKERGISFVIGATKQTKGKKNGKRKTQ